MDWISKVMRKEAQHTMMKRISVNDNLLSWVTSQEGMVWKICWDRRKESEVAPETEVFGPFACTHHEG